MDNWGPTGALFGYLPTVRGWFVEGISRELYGWTDIYLWYDSKNNLGITRSAALRDPVTNEKIGVATADITLFDINQFFSKLKVSTTGKAFIVDKSGLLIATTAGSHVDGSRMYRLPVINSTDPIISGVAKYLIGQYGDFHSIFNTTNNNASLYISPKILNDNMYILMSVFYLDPRIDWIIVVIIPESDVLYLAHQSTTITMSVTAATLAASLLIAVILSLVLGWVVANPLRSFTKQMMKIANVDFDEKHNASSLYEFLQMNEALLQMKKGLSQFKKFVPKALMGSIGNSNIATVQLGTNSTKEFTMLHLGIADFKYPTFEQIGKWLENVGLIVRKHKGFIAKFYGSRCVALFAKKKQAAKSAREIQQIGLTVGAQLIHTSVAIVSGTLTVGTIGENDFIDTIMFSPHLSLLLFLHSLHNRYGTKFLVTKSEMDADTGFSSIPNRLVGKYNVKGLSTLDPESVTLVEVFELLDRNGEDPNMLNEYNRAVNMYYAQDNYIKMAAAFAALNINSTDPLLYDYFLKSQKVAGKNSNLLRSLPVSEGIKNPTMLDELHQFCKKERSTENVDLFKAILQYQRNDSAEERKALAKTILTQYINMDALQCVNIMDSTREELARAWNQNNFDKTVYDGLVAEILMLVNDTWKRFRNSPQYEEAFFQTEACVRPKVPLVDLKLYGF